jgi:hypothetical protein
MTKKMNLHPQYVLNENGEKVSVILPIDEYNALIEDVQNDDLSYLNDEIEKGFDSPLSEKSHKEIFSELRLKYA